MVKNSDRARLEKALEDLMDNDWRVFRARLVAQEKSETLESSKQFVSTRGSQETHAMPTTRDDKQVRQDNLGNLFAAIFSDNRKREKDGERKEETYSIFDRCGATLHKSCDDPFEAETSTLMTTKSSINKHRWSHPLSHIEPGCVLIANDQLGGCFFRTVVLITEHSDKRGSVGFVINKYVVSFYILCFFVCVAKLNFDLNMALQSILDQ